MHTGIIADDLTGAADGGAPFARAGHRVFVGFGSRGALPGHGADVVALDLDPRVQTPSDAAALAAKAGRRLRNAPLLYKTMDFTLRGHVGIEVAAAPSASGRTVALVAPAFPAAGRTTLGGVQHADGEPAHRTAVARDLRRPVRVSRVAHLFGGTGLGPVAELHGGEAQDAGRVRQALATAQVVVADACTNADLDALLAAYGSTGVLWVGSPRIAQALARVRTARPAVQCANLPETRCSLILVGSLHPASRAQARMVEATLGVQAVEIDPAHAASNAGAVEVARRIVGEGLVDGLVATDGDTVLAAAWALRAEDMHLWRELEPGVPLGGLAGPQPVPVVTRAGGFGDPGALLRLCAALGGSASTTQDERLPA